MNSYLKHKILIKINGELSLLQTLFCGQAFRWIQKDEKFFAVALGQYVCVYVENQSLVVESDQPLDTQKWVHYFGLDTDYPAIHQKLRLHPILKKCVDNASGIRVLNQDFFEMLITFIISQNNNIPRITSIVERLCQQFGDMVCEGVYTFPTAKKLCCLSLDDLAPLRAGFRAKYILDAAQKVASGIVSQKTIDTLSLADASLYLQQIKGVGPKVADCVLLFGLGRVQAFPKDVWIKRAIAELFSGELPSECIGIEGIAQQYIFEYIRNLK